MNLSYKIAIILKAIEQVLQDGPRTPDLGGTTSTMEMGQVVIERM